ncbi:MAG TPA: class I SAM-dependent methyltransferase [Stellaceae bacterium]|nr:class I SAM-dependent methyltransferase [Stellaceae bacterium]
MSTTVNALHRTLVFDRRTRVLAERLVALLPRGASVLDVGCGDGTIASLVLQHRSDISLRGVDVLVRPGVKIPVEPFDGRQLPCADKSFDVVSFVDVLHHTDDPTILLREAKRVARKLVVLKDHTMDGVLAYQTLRFMDWVGNAAHGVALPYNYWPERKWRAAFDAIGLRVADWQARLGLYPYPGSLLFERGLHFVAALKPD